MALWAIFKITVTHAKAPKIRNLSDKWAQTSILSMCFFSVGKRAFWVESAKFMQNSFDPILNHLDILARMRSGIITFQTTHQCFSKHDILFTFTAQTDCKSINDGKAKTFSYLKIEVRFESRYYNLYYTKGNKQINQRRKLKQWSHAWTKSFEEHFAQSCMQTLVIVSSLRSKVLESVYHFSFDCVWSIHLPLHWKEEPIEIAWASTLSLRERNGGFDFLCVIIWIV